MEESLDPDPQKEMKNVDTEKKKLLFLSLEREKDIRKRESELMEQKCKLDKITEMLGEEFEHLKNEVQELCEIKQLFLVQAKIIEVLIKENPKYLTEVCNRLNIPQTDVRRLMYVTKEIRAGKL
jgi:hypothetical protein